VGSSTPPRLDQAVLSGRATETVQHVLLGEAIDAAPVLVFVADDGGNYVAVNNSVCETLGYTRAEMLGKRVSEVAIAPEAPDLYEAMMREGSASGVTHIRRRDGTLVRMRYYASEVTVARVQFWVSVGIVEADA
jgi:PAS domain S-box-containing protein